MRVALFMAEARVRLPGKSWSAAWLTHGHVGGHPLKADIGLRHVLWDVLNHARCDIPHAYRKFGVTCDPIETRRRGPAQKTSTASA